MPSRTPERAPGLKVASVAGVPVYIGASWLILAAVIVGISASNLSELGALSIVVGVAYALSLLVAVLLHESAHAVMARHFDIPVHRVVADLWGGHTAFDGRFLTPGRAAAVAVVGPLSNLALGLAGLAIGSQLDGVPGMVVRGIGLVNTVLAAFNLLPGLPLDGGQLVDALVWRITGERSRGLVVAGWCGRVVTILVVLWAIGIPLLAGNQPSITTVLWSLLIAGFLWSGASNAIQSGRARRMLASTTLGALARPVRVWPADTPAVTVLSAPEVALLRLPDEALALMTPPEGATLERLSRDVRADAMATRLPPAAVVMAGPRGDLAPAVTSIQATGWGVVVLTDVTGTPYGLITGADLSAALERAR